MRAEARQGARASSTRQRAKVAELSMQAERRDTTSCSARAGRIARCSACRSIPRAARRVRACCSVSPGGPAEEAGLVRGDVIVALDGKPISGDQRRTRTGRPDARREAGTESEGARAARRQEQGLRRGGAADDGLRSGNRMFNVELPEMGAFAMGGTGAAVSSRSSGTSGGPSTTSSTDSSSRASRRNSARISARPTACSWSPRPENGALKLEDGDVIQSIDGRKPDDGAHALRILRSYKSGEKLNLSVLRQRKSVDARDHDAGASGSGRGHAIRDARADAGFAAHAAVAPVPAAPPSGGASTLE